TKGIFTVPASTDVAGTPVELAIYDPSEAINSIAVLPLADFSEGGDQAYFTAGMHEELIAKLSMVEGLRVVSRTSVTQYAGTTKSAPAIGRELGVDALIEGSATRVGDQVRVTLQIIHARSDSHIQTLQFDREVTNVLALQTEIAHAVVHEIEGEHAETAFTEVAMNVEPMVQEAYLKGRYEYERGTPEGYRMAFDYFQDAVQNDPDFAPALTGIASARFMVDMEDGEANPVEVQLAREEAAQSLEMDAQSIETREVLSLIERSIPRLMPEAPVEGQPTMVHVVSIPGMADSIVMDISAFDTTWVDALTGLGDKLERLVRLRMVRGEGDGLAERAGAARQLLGAGRFGDATELLEDVVSANPESTPAWSLLVRTHMSGGDPMGAVGASRDWSESGALGAPSAADIQTLERAVAESGAAGYWSWTLGRLTTELGAGGHVSHIDLAAANAGMGDDDAAFTHLAAALADAEPGLLTLRSDPVWDDLRRDSRFESLLSEARDLRFSPTMRGRRGGGRNPGNNR
ncbi:MAG: hypothetical protein GWP44_03785, partial [Proteobacteria bacterium]|nr:hypothetical protein [Pseudomonadota bacterium]